MSEFATSHQQLTSYGDVATLGLVLSDKLEDRTQDPWVQGELFIHYTTVAPVDLFVCSRATILDPGILERGFICIKVWGGCFADFISFFLQSPMKMK